MNATELFVISATVVIIAYDVLTFYIKQPTESTVIKNWAMRYTSIPFFGGVLMGHWFAPFKEQLLPNIALIYGIVILSGLVVFDVFWNRCVVSKKTPWFRYPFFYVILGAIAGAVFWGQAYGNSPF